ncbi:MAG: hypothetical protein Q4G63_09035 [Bacteroidia bacterium]|nr:hypothetical protein [Bacteroidia bacterium]
MKIIVFICFYVLFLVGCNTADKMYMLQIQDVKSTERNILALEKLMNKIPIAPHYENTYPEYVIDDKGYINILYSNIKYNSVDSIVEGRYNPNLQRIDNLYSIEGLTTNEFSELKKIIFSLKKDKINSNEYLYNEFSIKDHSNQIKEEYKCPFFAYPYDVQEWMVENPEKKSYIIVLNDEQLKSKCFKENFEVKDRKDKLYLIVMK